jgi:hypothetical protein
MRIGEHIRKRRASLGLQLKGMTVILSVLVAFILFLMLLTLAERLVLG